MRRRQTHRNKEARHQESLAQELAAARCELEEVQDHAASATTELEQLRKEREELRGESDVTLKASEEALEQAQSTREDLQGMSPTLSCVP